MKNLILILLSTLFFVACEEKREMSSIDVVVWKNREVTDSLPDSLLRGATYLSVYSQIYCQSDDKSWPLTATVSIRNINRKDTIYIDKAEYFNTHGESIRSYFNHTIFLAPLETVEIVIDENDNVGGTGANFVFDWRHNATSIEPHFESVMISISGQQGLSFITQGQRSE